MAVARSVLKKKFGCNQCCLAQKRQQVVPFFDNNQVQYPGGRTQPEHIRRACACASERAARAATLGRERLGRDRLHFAGYHV